MSRESPTLKKGDLIVIENTDNLRKSINEFYKKWEMVRRTATSMALDAQFASAATATVIRMATSATTVTENETGKQVKIKYHGLGWKPFETKRLIGIVTEITKEEHRDLDVIKIREQTGGSRYCRRYILENV